MSRIQQPWRRARLPLGVSVAALLAAPAQAVSFNIGEVEGQFDSTLTVGASWATARPDADLIGANNGGRGLSQTSDDSHLNFKRGETFSKIFKGVHDLELKYRDSGLFLRGKYWYDFELKDEGRPFKAIDDSNRKQGAQASGAELLDAFVYQRYTLGELPGTVRLGRQVVSWGESTFLQGSVNAINPIDVAAFRRPGSELREGLIPVNMFYVAQNLSDNLSLEAFYQLEWDQTVVDNCGTFFSQPDLVADGCADNLAVLRRRDALAASLGPLAPAVLGVLQANGASWGAPDEGVRVRRGADRDARDDGQFGVALRYYVEPLGTEFGAYFVNYHSRAPIFSATAADPGVFGLLSPLNPAGLGPQLVGAGVPLAQAGSVASQIAPLLVAGNSRYFIEYPEDIRLYGLSFSTTLPSGTAWSGEISYRPNAPVQINTTDILYGGLTPLDPNLSLVQATPGRDAHGYRRKEITQLQTTFTHFFDQVMGASRLTLVGEIGWTHVGGLESRSKLRYGRDPVFGPGPLPNGRCQTLNAGTLSGAEQRNLSRYCEDDGFTTRNSWGYRLRAVWDYNDAIAGINLKPNLAWSHDVDGYSPGPGGNFEEGRKAISVGLDADYQNTYTASLAYTDFFGGKYNTLVDRDFLSLSFGMSF